MSHGTLYIRKKARGFAVPKIAIAAILTTGAFWIRYAARNVSGFADRFAQHINSAYVGTLGRAAGLVSFSVVEILIYLLILDILLRVITLTIAAVRRESDARKRWTRFVTNWCILAALIFLLFEMGEDVYFYCTPFSEKIGVGSGSYSTEDLTAVCRMLIDECNAEAGLVARDDEGLMIISDGLSSRIVEQMESLGNKYPELAGLYNPPKPVLFSWLMSKTDMAGIYSAYTSEANYNRDMTDYNIPFTMSHEMAHTHGVLQENEANFVAYLNCTNAEDDDIRYAGAVSGWIYCGNELYKRDYDAWHSLAVQLDARVDADLEANTAFWKKYRGEAATAAQDFNDSYLKSHGQSEGTESYDRVVDLIVSYEMGKM